MDTNITQSTNTPVSTYNYDIVNQNDESFDYDYDSTTTDVSQQYYKSDSNISNDVDYKNESYIYDTENTQTYDITTTMDQTIQSTPISNLSYIYQDNDQNYSSEVSNMENNYQDSDMNVVEGSETTTQNYDWDSQAYSDNSQTDFFFFV